MPNLLTPHLDGQRVSVAAVLANPTWLRIRIEELVEADEIISTFFSPLGAPVTGGGILHPRLAKADKYTSDDVLERAPGDEYTVVRAVDPEYRLAAVRDYGGKVVVTDEEIARSDMSSFNNKILQLSNTVSRKLQIKAMAAIDAAGPDLLVAARAWDDVVTVGPDATLTPNGDRPLADIARVRGLFTRDQIGLVPDTMALSAEAFTALTVAYGEQLDAVIRSANVKLVVNPYIPESRAYFVQKGRAGLVGFEAPLTIDVIDKRETREKVIQAYAVPSFAVDRPAAVKVLGGVVAPEVP